MHDLGMVEKIHPVLIGDYVADTEAYTDYFVDGGHPAPLPTVCVRAVEEKLRSHMESQVRALSIPHYYCITSRARAELTPCFDIPTHDAIHPHS